MPSRETQYFFTQLRAFTQLRVPFGVARGVFLARIPMSRLIAQPVVSAFVALGFVAGAALAQTPDPLNATFARIDAAAKTFKGMSAQITNTQHTAIVDDNDVQTGSMKVLRVKPGVTRALVEFKSQI